MMLSADFQSSDKISDPVSLIVFTSISFLRIVMLFSVEPYSTEE